MRRPVSALLTGTAALLAAETTPAKDPGGAPRTLPETAISEAVPAQIRFTSPAESVCRPQPAVVARGQWAHASGGRTTDGVITDTPDGPLDVEDVLATWERASLGLEPPRRFDRLRLAHTSGIGRGRHELDLAHEFHGPVEAADLKERFRWLAAERKDGAIHLEAEPTDDVERMFVPRFELVLDAATWCPKRIEFGDDADGQPAASLAIAPRPNVDLLVAGFDEGRYDPAIPTEWCGTPGTALVQTAQLVPGVAKELRDSIPLAPGVERVLAHWEAATAGKPVEASVRRFAYDLVFNVEKRSNGRFRFDGSGAGALELEPTTLAAEQSSDRRDASGRRFKLVPDRPESWTVDEGRVEHVVYEDDAEPREWPIQGGWIQLADFTGGAALAPPFPHQVLPLVVDIDADTLPEHFNIRKTHETSDQIWLQFEPRSNAARFRELTVILDKHTWLPAATQMLDASGSTEVVYTFADWKQLPGRAERSHLIPPLPAPLDGEESLP